MCLYRSAWIATFLTLVATAHARAEDLRVRFHATRTDESYCGIDCLYVSLRICGETNLSLKDLERELALGPHGLSVEQLVDFAEKRAHSVNVVHTDIDAIRRCSGPLILHVDRSHFVVLVGFVGRHLLIFDNGVGLFHCTPEWFLQRYGWEGLAISFGPPTPEMFFGMHGSLLLGICAVGALCFLVAARWRDKRWLLVPQGTEPSS